MFAGPRIEHFGGLGQRGPALVGQQLFGHLVGQLVSIQDVQELELAFELKLAYSVLLL